MKTSKIFLMAAMALSAFGLQSCLDYDTPSDEFQKETTVVTPPTISTGKADSINYNVEITEKMYQNAYKRLRSHLGTALTGIYSIRGGKEGGKPEAHAYQFQFCLGPDNYVQYSCVPHSDFPYSNAELKSTYHLSKGFNGGPGGGFSSCKTCIAPVLNNGDLDSIPELKAAYLLLYNYAAIENADMFGPMPYNDFKKNRDESPFKYDDVRTIYYSAKANIDSCIAAFKHFQKRPEWYKTKVVKNIFINRLPLLKNADLYEAEGLQPWIEFANSLKLRMAIHLAKVEPQTAKEWAEAAFVTVLSLRPHMSLLSMLLFLVSTILLFRFQSGVTHVLALLSAACSRALTTRTLSTSSRRTLRLLRRPVTRVLLLRPHLLSL